MIALRVALWVLLVLTFDVSALGQGTTITILHVGDTHSHLDATGPKDKDLNGTLGGIAKAATVIKSIRESEPNVLLLHSGDLFQGDLFFNKYLGVPELQIMTQLGFDAMAVGNHEFDLGPAVLNGTLLKAFTEGSFPLLSANLDLSGFPGLKKWIFPSVLRTVGGVRIGLFGMTIPDDPTTQPAPVVIQADIISIAQRVASELRTAGAEVVICLSHLGLPSDRMLAEKVSGIDLIAGGHDHIVVQRAISVKHASGKRTWIIHGGEHYKYLGKLRLRLNRGAVEFLDYKVLTIGASVAPDTAIQKVVASLKEDIVRHYGDVYHTVIARAAKELESSPRGKSRHRDSSLGNLITDAFRNKTGTDIALTANGLISAMIWAGPIVPADVFRAVSYGFDDSTRLGYRLATFDISGSELLKGLEHGVSQVGANDNYFLQVSGMTYSYDPKRPAGERMILESVRIKGKPISLEGKYTMTVNTGIIGLLSKAGVIVENIRELEHFEYTVVKDYIEKLSKVSSGSEGRIQDVSVNLDHHGKNSNSEKEIVPLGSKDFLSLRGLARFPEEDPEFLRAIK